MKSAATGLVLLFIVSILSGAAPHLLAEGVVHHSPTNPTGVDLRVTDASVEYTSSTDEAKYKMFSSNHPILGFNRPAELFVIDAMVNVSVTLTITVENIGTASSGTVDVNVLLLHDDYDYFEFVNSTTQMAALSGGGSNTVTVPVVPGYAGNHTLAIRVTPAVSDDNPNNNLRQQPFTVGHTYFNCDASTSWSFGSGWMLSTDTSISQGRSCHAGNGQSSNYNNNVIAALTTPVMDMSDALPNPTRTNGVSFFYTGSTAANDKLTIFGRNAFGAWSEVGSITGTIDNVFTDGANWQTFSVANKGHSSPLIPVPDDLFHATSQFKFEFTSDATGTDIGFYIDDVVIVYEQKVRPEEFSVSAQGVSTNGAIAGDWGNISLNIINTGNISEIFIPRLDGLPASWNAYYTRPSGTSFDPNGGLISRPGNPASFNIMIQPDVNASLGFQQMTVNITSKQYPSVSTELPVQFLVKADRIPVILPPPVRPSCPPSFTCTFDVGLTNRGGATDVFDVSLDTTTVPNDWTIALAWSQHNAVLLRPNETVQALFTLTAPADAAPDTVVEFDLRLTSQNDTSRSDVKTIPVSASMVSIAEVALQQPYHGAEQAVNAGDQVVLKYTIWNNATRQDIFSMRVNVENEGEWVVHQPTRPDAVLNPGTSTSFEVVVDVPHDARAEETGPTLTPVIESKRSLMEIEGEPFAGLRVQPVHDLRLLLLEAPAKLKPGVPNELQWRVLNEGNGPAMAHLHINDASEDWTWWLEVDGANITDSVRMDGSNEAPNEKNISMWILIPTNAPAGGLNTITVEASHEDGVGDQTPQNNAVEVIMSTEAVRIPSLQLVNQSSTGMAGTTVFAQAVLQNEGNAPESSLTAVGRVSSTPPVPGLIVFFSVEGASVPLNTPTPVLVPAGGSQTLQLEALLPEDASLNTRFVLEFEILGVVDDEGLPVLMKTQALVMINEQRQIDSEAGLMIEGDVPHGTAAQVQVNITSMSTMNEDVLLALTGPEGWQITCNKMLVNESGIITTLAPGHMSPQSTNQRCEVLRLDGPQQGQLTVVVQAVDGTMETGHTLELNFQPTPEAATMSGTLVLGAGGGFLLVLALTFLLLRSRRGEHDDVEALSPTAGPPISSTVHEKEVPGISSETTATPPAQEERAAGPPVPAEGIPAGWTEEQWRYYGQQYLDGTL